MCLHTHPEDRLGGKYFTALQGHRCWDRHWHAGILTWQSATCQPDSRDLLLLRAGTLLSGQRVRWLGEVARGERVESRRRACNVAVAWMHKCYQLQPCLLGTVQCGVQLSQGCVAEHASGHSLQEVNRRVHARQELLHSISNLVMDRSLSRRMTDRNDMRLESLASWKPAPR